MADLINFTFHKNVIHTQLINDTPYFLAKDVCNVLGYKLAAKTIKDHVVSDDVLKRNITDDLGRQQLALWINESGLYSLILGSKLPNAKSFKHWITSQVLPALRETGHYECVSKLPDHSSSPCAPAYLVAMNETDQCDMQLRFIMAKEPLFCVDDLVIDFKDKVPLLNFYNLDCFKKAKYENTELLFTDLTNFLRILFYSRCKFARAYQD